MYIEFYGLNSKPFRLTPDPEFFFMSAGHKKAMTYLKYAINDGEGFAVITGEIGAGKTTLLRTVMKSLSMDGRTSSLTAAFIKNTIIAPEHFVRLVADDFGIDIPSGMEKDKVLGALNNFLIKQFSENKTSLLIIDEAQNLSISLLEEIRLLSNLETDKHKLLQIILVGQPELKQKLASPQLEQLRQRVFLSYHLGALSRKETEEYVKHRLHIAGGDGIFKDEVFDEIYDFSNGVPRLTNVICTFALLCGFAEEKRVIDLSIVKSAREEVEKDMLKGDSSTNGGDPFSGSPGGAESEQIDAVIKRWKNITAKLLKQGVL